MKEDIIIYSFMSLLIAILLAGGLLAAYLIIALTSYILGVL